MAGLWSPDKLPKVVAVKYLVGLVGMEGTVWSSFNVLLGERPKFDCARLHSS